MAVGVDIDSAQDPRWREAADGIAEGARQVWDAFLARVAEMPWGEWGGWVADRILDAPAWVVLAVAVAAAALVVSVAGDMAKSLLAVIAVVAVVWLLVG